VQINADLPLKALLQLGLFTDIHAIIFVNIGGIEPLYSGAQKIKLSAFWNKPSIFLISLNSVFCSI